jgi:hypothetical protein
MKVVFTEEEAIEKILNVQNLKRYYPCVRYSLDSDAWHVTSQDRAPYEIHNGNMKESTERELKKDMADAKVLNARIVQFMRHLWITKGTYKVSSSMVTEHITDKPKATIYSALSSLKKTGDISNLDEKVPDQKGAVYFALNEVLDKVTDPNAKKEVMASIPQQASTEQVISLATVNDAYNTILAKLDGMAKGYTENTKVLGELRANSKSYPEAISYDVVGQRLDGTMESWSESIVERIVKHIGETTPSSVVDVQGNDYKSGLKDGIRLAAEMGLIVPKTA